MSIVKRYLIPREGKRPCTRKPGSSKHSQSTVAQVGLTVAFVVLGLGMNTQVGNAQSEDNRFSAQEIISTDADIAQSVYARDLDGDGDADVLSASSFDEKIAWYENQGGEGFSQQKIISTDANGARSVYARDLDGDGDADVLSASNAGADDKIAWYENQEGGGFSEQKIISTDADGAKSVYARDLDGDGDADVLSASDSDNKIAWYENQEGEGFSEQKIISTDADGAYSVYARDLDGDGDADVLSASYRDDKIAWYENGGGGAGTLFPPSGVAATDDSTAVGLTWNGSSSSNLAKYRIYRDTAPIDSAAGPSSLAPLDSVSSGTTTYQDTSAKQGQTYFYRLTTVGSSGEESSFSSQSDAFLYPTFIGSNIARFADTDGQRSEYRLIAVPGRRIIRSEIFDLSVAEERPIREILPGNEVDTWSAYWDDGTESSYYAEHDSSDTFKMRAGRGFWALSTEPWSLLPVTASFTTVALEGDSAAVVDLHSGWNIISNPTEKDVAWSHVQRENGLSGAALWRFDGTFTEAQTLASAQEGEAFYFLNSEGLEALRVPYPGSPPEIDDPEPSSKRQKRAGPALALRAAQAAGDTSRVAVRFASGAKEGFGESDVVAPTSRFAALGLRLENPAEEPGPRRRFLATERRPEVGNGQTFDLRLWNRSESPVEVGLAEVRGLEGRRVELLVPQRQKSHDLRRAGPVRLAPGPDTVEAKLVVGSEGYAAKQRQQVAPEKLSLMTYPNPARRQATLRYALPEEQEVRLVLYDMLGREVKTLVDGPRPPGRHRARLRADQLPSGVYFGRLKAGDQTRTQKIVVVR